MHEMSLCQSIVDIVREQALAASFRRVTTVRLEIGALSSVEPDALRFAFDAVTPGTPAEGARLDIVPVPGAARCLDCDALVQIARRGDACPYCRGYSLHVEGGEQMRVKELEVE